MTKSLLLVHGAWHNGAGFDALVAELAKHDIAATTVELTSVGHEDAPLGDLYSDAALVREVVATLGDDVAVLGHSYGGVVITEALAGVDNVSHLIYLTAFMLDEGESLYAACGSVDPEWWVRSPDDQRLSTATPDDVFYNTCEPSVAAQAVDALRWQSVASFMNPVTQVAWREVPSTYVVCELDQAIPVFAQEAMSQRAGTVVRMSSDHSPFLCQPAALADVIAAALR